MLQTLDLVVRQVIGSETRIEPGALCGVHALAGIRDEQRALALAEVIARRLSGDIRIPEHAENVVAQLESPRECVRETSRLVKNVHVKDFAFARQDGWVGFTYSGARMGEGLHDYGQLLDVVRPRERGINEVVEHWLPWQTDAETTIRTERDWTRATLEYLRSTL